MRNRYPTVLHWYYCFTTNLIERETQQRAKFGDLKACLEDRYRVIIERSGC
jgi:hypothetical protein